MAKGQHQPKVKKVPQRMCLGCSQLKPKRELLRVVRTPDGVIEFDSSAAGKKSGRGAYLCPSRDCLAKAIKAKRLERALEHPIAQEVWVKLEAGMVTTG
jgi:predicted RNA-binding protein YlxR (DUF448 family)